MSVGAGRRSVIAGVHLAVRPFRSIEADANGIEIPPRLTWDPKKARRNIQ